MSEPINDGGPAFPVIFDHSDCTSEQEGMSLRDYFAAKAMAELIASFAGGDSTYAEKTAEHCYRFADAMLAERSKRK